MRVVVPYAESAPKSRLSAELDADERRAFARAMLADVLSAVREAGETPTVLTPDADAVGDADARVVVDERPLTPAVNAVLDDADAATSPVAVVMADLALATPASLRRLFDAEGDVVVAPGRGGGTNALVVRHPAFRADYHGVSYRDHRERAADAGLAATVVDSMRLATDVDEPADLAEVLLHADGRARTWLADAGFELDASGGRVGVSRD